MTDHTGANIRVTEERDLTTRELQRRVGDFDTIFDHGHIDHTVSYYWEKYLVFGKYDIKEVLRQVADKDWQRVRVSMLGTSHQFKWTALIGYLGRCDYNFHSRCVVTNYVYALKRGGVIK
jgi:hypothetical protein